MEKCERFATESQAEGHILDIIDFKWKQTQSMYASKQKTKSIQTFQANKNTINDLHMWVESFTFLSQGCQTFLGEKRHLV